MTDEQLWLAAIALFAATINGALGYGFSSITVPLALLFLSSRVLNPALVLVEVVINLYALAVNCRSAGSAARRTWTIIVGLVPGILIGSELLSKVSPDTVKLFTYVVLLPLIMFQAGGIRRPFRSEHAVGLPFGIGLGFLYSITTISGPPLAVFFTNQGYAKQEFKAALAVVRVAESSMTALAYAAKGMFTAASIDLTLPILPAILVGVPLGAWLVLRFDLDLFRRLCMSFDAWIVGFGLSKTLAAMAVLPGARAYGVMAAVVLIDAAMLWRFFSRRASPPSQAPPS